MEKVMESHGIWRAQKNTNPVNYMCSVVLIITGKDLPVPISRVQNVSCWNGNSEEPRGPPPTPPPYLRVWMTGTPPSRAQKNTNPVNYMCSVVLIITGKDLPVPISRVQNVSCWNGNSEEPRGPPPHPTPLSQGLDDRDPSFSEGLD